MRYFGIKDNKGRTVERLMHSIDYERLRLSIPTFDTLDNIGSVDIYYNTKANKTLRPDTSPTIGYKGLTYAVSDEATPDPSL